MTRPTSPPGKPDDQVGAPGAPAADAGRQTADQAALTDLDSGAAPRPEPKAGWGKTGEPGRSPPAIGGSSGGHSDQVASRGPAADTKIAGENARMDEGNTP